MKPQMIAKRNAELRRKAREQGETDAHVDVTVAHSFPTPRNERRRELLLAALQGLGGLALILAGAGLTIMIFWAIPLMFGGAWAGAALMVLLLFFPLLLIVLVAFGGVAMIRMGAKMLRASAFQQHEAPILRALSRLSYDAVPITGYIVGTGSVTNHVLITFETHPDERLFMLSLASQLSEPTILEELLGDIDYVPGRRTRLPHDIAGGRTIYLADLRVRHSVARRLAVPCVAEVGASGGIAISQ